MRVPGPPATAFPPPGLARLAAWFVMFPCLLLNSERLHSLVSEVWLMWGVMTRLNLRGHPDSEVAALARELMESPSPWLKIMSEFGSSGFLRVAGAAFFCGCDVLIYHDPQSGQVVRMYSSNYCYACFRPKRSEEY